MYLDLNTITTKEQFAETLLMIALKGDDIDGFYVPNEDKILSMDFELEEFMEEFENWLVANNDLNY